MDLPENNLYKILTIKDVWEEVENFKLISFEEGHGIIYQPGQYLTLVHHANNEEIRRSYSITSTPWPGEPLSIGVKRVENGFFSRQLVDHAKSGDKLITIGAGGLFTLPENITDYRQVFFLAAGSGITPVYPLIKTILYSYPSISVVLIYSNPSPERTVFRDGLLQLQQQFSTAFHVEFLFSNSLDLFKARLYRELLLQLLQTYGNKDYSSSLYYICGPEAYMRMCTYVLQEQQVPKDHIKRENFVIQRLPPPQAFPPDKSHHNVTIRIAGSEYNFNVAYPDAILKSAKKNGISLPYSCEAGRCGNCVARCVKGKVWLSYNEVLTTKDLAKGLTLTCVGHPEGGDVILEL